MKPRVSIIIRTKNEGRWITPCLKAVFNQTFKDFEVILVDNNSTDKTVEKAKKFDVNIVAIDEYLPGKAINAGIDVSCGEYIAILSGHCIPKDAEWLANLVKNLDKDRDKEIAGVYGRQEPLSFTSDFDKRDLLITFGLDKRIQVKDSFFHNANSLVRRSVLEEIPFDSEVTNIEDRLWAKQVIDHKYKIIYEPEASVYHYHGIHQSADPERAKKVVRILESMDESGIGDFDVNKIDMNITAIITAKGAPTIFCGKPLISYTIQRAKESKLLTNIIVATDNEETKRIALQEGAQVPFVRPTSLSQEGVGVEDVLKYSLSQLEQKEIYPDLMVYLSILQPFRPPELIDALIARLLQKGFDSVMAGYPVYKSCWVQKEDEVARVDEGFVASSKKNPLHIGYAGLACVSYSEFIRQGRLLGDNSGIFEILDYYSTIEVKAPSAFELAEKIFLPWWAQHEKVTDKSDTKESLSKTRNSKHETRNNDQILKTKIQNIT